MKLIVELLAHVWITHYPGPGADGEILFYLEFGGSFAKALAGLANRKYSSHTVKHITGQSIEDLVQHCRRTALSEDTDEYERLSVAAILRQLITLELDASVMHILIRKEVISMTAQLILVEDELQRPNHYHFDIVCIWRLIFNAARDFPQLALEAMRAGLILSLSRWSMEDYCDERLGKF